MRRIKRLSSEDSIRIKCKLDEKITKAFSIFDGKHKNRIHKNAVSLIFHSIGLVPTERDTRHFINDTVDKDGFIHLKAFMTHLKKRFENNKMRPLSSNKLLDLFKQLDPQNIGYIERDKFNFALRKYGETMTDEEIREMINAALSLDDDKKIDYLIYTNKLTVKEVDDDDYIYNLAAEKINKKK